MVVDKKTVFYSLPLFIDFILKMCNNISMEKIGIFGGTFNPVHSEHIAIAKSAIEELGLDKLIIMPTFISPHKQQDLALSPEHRLNMLKLAFKGDERIEISDYEIEKKGTSYTYLTVEHFFSLQPCELFFIVGGDMLTNFKTWKYPERILAVCNLAVFSRDGVFTDFSLEKQYFKEHFGKEFIRLSFTGKDFSSTKIRVLSAFSLPIDHLTPLPVAKYIEKNNLYQFEKYSKYIEFVKKALPQKRLLHTANVVICALSKAKELNLKEDKVFISATLHDVAKYLYYRMVDGFTLLDNVPEPVIHSFLGAFVAEKELGITDPEILDAIRYHTSGKANMSLLGKLIFVADMVEEGRDYQGVSYLRELYQKDDFEFCFNECLREEFLHLKNKGTPIYVETLNAYNYYIKTQEK